MRWLRWSKPTQDATHSVSARPGRNERHTQALDIVRQQEEDGRPFILYLRDFRGGERVVREQHHERHPFTIDNKLLEQVSPDIGVVFIQSEAEEKHWEQRPSNELGPQGPGLQLPNDGWQQVAARLIELAEVIFVDAPLLSAGTRFELETCLSKSRVHHTVVVLDAPNHMRWQQSHTSADEGNELIQRFTRVVWADDLHKDVVGNFAVKDLIDRARAIAASPRETRCGLIRSGTLNQEFPVRYEGVADEYIFRSALRAQSRTPWHADPWEDNWERTFWGFHRAVLVMHATIALGLVKPEACADRLVECYRAMVNLLGENLITDRGMVMRGHYELCRRLSEIAVRWAAHCEDTSMRQVCQDMLQEATSRAQMLQSRATLMHDGVSMNIPYGPILKTLYFADSGEFVRCPREDSAES